MEEVFILNKFLDKIKGKLSPKKKGDDEEFEEEEILDDDESAQDEVTNPNYDKTSATNTEIDTDEEESDEPEQTKSIVDKLKAKLLKKKSKAEDDEDEDEEEGDGKKKRKVSPIAIIVVVGLIIFLFVPDQNSDKPEDAPAEPILKTPAYKKNKPQVTEEPKKEDPAIEAPATENPVIEEPTIDEPVIEEPTPAPTPSTESDTSSIDDILSEDPVVSPADDIPTPEPMPEPAPIEDIDLSGMNTDTGEDSIDGGVSSDSDQGDMTDQILKDLESQVNKEQPKAAVNTYVAPPDYEYRGRGLVYNCSGKHWACVDGPSYKQCEDNNTFQTQKSAKIECYPFNVYENGRGCEQMQNRLVSSGAKTDFCKN